MKRREKIKDYEDSIVEAIARNGPYSHNIISMALGAVAQKFGKEEANKLIDKFKLERLGWKKE